MTKVLLEELVDIQLEIRSRKLNGEKITEKTTLKSVCQWHPIALKYHEKNIVYNEKFIP